MIAIMGAMPEEIAPLLVRMDHYEEVIYAKNRYYLASYEGKSLVIAYSKIGKVFAALTAATMIEKFGATRLLFSGVAGAINPDLKIGDLIVATKLCQHDLDITAFGHPYGYVPEGSVYVESDPSLRAIAQRVASQKGINLHEGIIATGDQFVADLQRKTWIAKEFGADALEMEGAASLLSVKVWVYRFLFCVQSVMLPIWMRDSISTSFWRVLPKRAPTLSFRC